MPEKISVIIPVYKVEKYLNRCVESVVQQTYGNLEIILVDDGSPDNCPQICDNWAKKDNRIIVIHKENGGLSDARNAGIERSTGEYITFVDSDDLISRNMIEVLYKTIVSEDVDIAVTTMKPFYKELPKLDDNEMNVVSGDASLILTEIIYKSSKWEACGKLYKKSLFENGVRFIKGKLYEDLHFMPRVFRQAKRATISNSEMYYYYQRSDSIMGESRNCISKDLIEILRMNITFITKEYIEEPEVCNKLFAAFIIHPSTKLEAIEINNLYKNNAPFIVEYKNYIREHWPRIKKNTYISSKYKIALFVSSISVRFYNKLFKNIRFLQRNKILKWTRK